MNCFRNLARIGSSALRIRHFGMTNTLLKGHAKWQNVKHIKAAKDQIKALMVAKQLRAIRLAAQGNCFNFNHNIFLHLTLINKFNP